MIGAIAGDYIGSVYEANPIKTKDFPLFHHRCQITDDSVLTIAIADVILHDGDYTQALQTYGRRYPHAGYGGTFRHWIYEAQPRPYNSWGNGAAMRVSPVGFAYAELDTVLAEAARTAEITHNHAEGIKGAQATAAAVFLARTEHSKDEIKAYVEQTFGYDLSRSLAEIRPRYHFDVSCQGTVPQAIQAFLESTDFEDAIRNAISLGGDADTLACIAGSMAQAFYGGVPAAIADPVLATLDPPLRRVTDAFVEKFCV
jgi:ADP-ribosylglycohydrolase